MQGQLCLKLISKIPRNPASTITNSISSKPGFSSSSLKTDANPFHQQFFSQHSTLSHSHLWKICSNNGVSGRIRNGFFSSPVFARRCFSNALSKGLSKFPINGAVGAQTRRNFHSLDSQNRERRSVVGRLTAGGVVIWLIVTNVAVFMLARVASPEFMDKNFMISVDNFTSGRLHMLITSAFSNRTIVDLIMNIGALSSFGWDLGSKFGPKYLLKLYLSGAVVSSIFYLAYYAFIAPSFRNGQMLHIDPSKIPGVNEQTLSTDPSKIPGPGAGGAMYAMMLLDIILWKTINFNIKIPSLILLGTVIVGNDILKTLLGIHDFSGSAHYLAGATVAALAWGRRIRKGHVLRF